ncbi:STAS domain-containing protein [Flindersiella endophytica]
MRIARLATPIMSAVVSRSRRSGPLIPTQRGPDPALRRVDPLVFLELSGPLVEGTAPALADVVNHRVLTPPPTVAAVIDLCGVTALDGAGRIALVRLHHDLEVNEVELHLTATSDVLDDLTEENALAPVLHTAARVAILAAYAAVPGPAIVTPAAREIFQQEFEPVTLVPDDAAPADLTDLGRASAEHHEKR